MAHHFSDNVHTKSFTPREYQVELLDAAKERNIIVCLGTESGKSFIAMKLIQEMANDTRRAFGCRRDGGRGGKRTLFLVEQKKKANKISLGLMNLTDLTVSNIWRSESSLIEWSDGHWMQEARSHQVLVMSSQMCYTILKRGILSLKYVNLLIMDQCHRAIQGHPYTKIMSEFYQKLPQKRRPRILGLTAPLLLLMGCPVPEGEELKKAPHPAYLEARLERLEITLDCTAETASDIVSLLRYCPRPRELVVEWSLAKVSDPVGIALTRSIESELTAAWDFLQDHRYDPMEIYQDAEFAEELSGIPDPKNDPIAVLKDFLHILRTLGPWCADRAALLLLIQLDKLKVKTPYERHFLLLCMMTTIMVKIRGICDLTFQEYKECERIYKFSTPKVLRFLEILREFLPPVVSERMDTIPKVQSKEDIKDAKDIDSISKTDSPLKQQNKDGQICLSETKNEPNTDTFERVSQTADGLASDLSVSNEALQLNVIREIDSQIVSSHEEYKLNEEISKKNFKCNVSHDGGCVSKSGNNFGSNTIEGLEKYCKFNALNTDCNFSSVDVKNLPSAEVNIMSGNFNKPNLNSTENLLRGIKECRLSLGDATGFVNKEASVWDHRGRGRRWGGFRGRGRGSRGSGRGQGPSNWTRSGLDLPVSDSLCGIVFVDGRFTAKILYHLLNDLRRADPQFASLAAQYTVGCSMPVAGDSSSSLDPREAEAEYRKQEEVLKRFRTHECNLLIGPTGWALEDGGLELPRCNLVLRFDHESVSTEIISLPSNQSTVQTLSIIDNDIEKTHNSVLQDIRVSVSSSTEQKQNSSDTVKEFKEDEASRINQENLIISVSSELKRTNLNSLSSKISYGTEGMENMLQGKNALALETSSDNCVAPAVRNNEIISPNNVINELNSTVGSYLNCMENGAVIEPLSEDKNVIKAVTRLHEYDMTEQLEEEVVQRIPVSYHSYARSRARARAPDAHHIIMAAEGEEAHRVVDSLAHFMQIEEMLLRRCKNREPPEEEEVEADGIALQGETYCPASLASYSAKAPRWGSQIRGPQQWNSLGAKDDAKGEKACVSLSTAISLVNRYCAKLPSDTFTRLTPLWSLKEITGTGEEEHTYICALRLPINSPVKQDILGHPMPSRALARRSAALEACKVLHQARELDDDLMPVGKESFRAEVESEEEEEDEEEEEEEEEDDEEENIKSDQDDSAAKMESSAKDVSGSLKVAEKETSLEKKEPDNFNTKINLEVLENNHQLEIECECMIRAVKNESELTIKDIEDVKMEDSIIKENAEEYKETAIEKDERCILTVKSNPGVKRSFVEMDEKLEKEVIREANEEILTAQNINESKRFVQTFGCDKETKSELNNTTNYMNDVDKNNFSLVEHERGNSLASVIHLKGVVENGLVKCNSCEYSSDRNLKSIDLGPYNNKKNKIVVHTEVIAEMAGKGDVTKDTKEIISSEVKVKEMKEHKHKIRKKREEEDLEEEGEDEVTIGEVTIGNFGLDRPRPGTTKRRQYYYKRTADALTDCRPLPMYPAYLYNIGMKLVCPLPDEQNTRGRRIHPPEDSPRGFGILTLKEIPKICPFPIFTRSGEVRICLEPCGSACPGKPLIVSSSFDSPIGVDLKHKFNVVPNVISGSLLPDPQQILLTEEQLSKALAFLNYTFAGVLRLQRYLMAFDPVASENSYLIVPTMAKKRTVKEESNEEMCKKNLREEPVEVDWEFVDLIYGCKGESKPVPVSEEERKSFEFEASLYHDAVVMPWYRNQDQPQYFYVAEICTHLSPKSSFPGSEYRTFEEYYFKKYAIQICNREQPLLDVDHTSARLNFLTPRYVNRKGVALPTSSEETKRAKRESLEQKQILVPELCSRHPFPASLWRKAVCLPCILYRLNALLLADQLRARVAREIGLGLEKVPKDFDWPPLDFGWSLADVLKKSKETENQNLDPKKGLKSGKSGSKMDVNNEEKSNDDNDESDGVEGDDRKRVKKKGLKRKKKKKKKNDDESFSGEEGRSDEDEANDDDDDSEKNEGEDWMEIGTWSNEMAVQSTSGSIPPLPENVTMVEEGCKEGWGTAVVASAGEEHIRYGSPSIWKGSSGPVEVFRGLEHDLEGLETTDSSGDDEDDDAPEDEEGVEEAILIPEEEVEDRGHHPRGKLRIQFKSDYLAEAVEVLDESIDDRCLLKIVAESSEDEDEVEMGEEEDSSWLLEEEDETDERQVVEKYVQQFDYAVMKNRKMIENSGMLLHSSEGFSLSAKLERASLKTEQVSQDVLYCPVSLSSPVRQVDTVFKDQDTSESLVTNTTTEDCDYISLTSLSDDDEDIFLDVQCGDEQRFVCEMEDARDIYAQRTLENDSRATSPCSSHSSACSCCSSCSSCSSPFWSSEEDIQEETSQDDVAGLGLEVHPPESFEMNQSFSFDAQPPLEGHPGPSPPLLLQALTMSNANDGINLERLETIGDSFLKYAITAYLYCTHHSIHEGKLSHLRSKQVSNVNLYRLGRRKRLGESMIAAKFEPHDNWLPPCYHVPLHLERALIRAGLPPSHWNGAEVPSLASLSPAQIGRVVREKGRRMMLKSLVEQETLKLSGPLRTLEGKGYQALGFEGNLDIDLEKGAKIEMQRSGNFGRFTSNVQGGMKPTVWDHGSRKKGFEQSSNFSSGMEGVFSKDSIPVTSSRASGDDHVEELPCFVPYNLVTQQSIPDKSVADCVEALIGAYLIACGPRGALLFMAWLGIRVLPSQKIIVGSPKDLLVNDKGERPVGCMPPKEVVGQKGDLYQVSYGTLLAPPPPLVLSSCFEISDQKDGNLKKMSVHPCNILCKHCLKVKRRIDSQSSKKLRGTNKKNLDIKNGIVSDKNRINNTKRGGNELELKPAVKKELKTLLGGLNEFEKHIGYYFRDRSLLLQALTHASYSPNRLTDCYQRLEFLGDAVLDYLITRHLYEDPRQHSPGALTDLRSALVNNTIFASLAVRHGFHRFFLHLSPGLHSVVERFVRMQANNGHAICEEYYLIEEEECEEAEDVEVPKALGDVFESVAGAIFLDSGMSLDAVWKVYYRMMKAEIEQFSTNVPKSPIRELLEMEPETAKFGKPEKLADGRRVRVTVEVFGKGTFKGIGRNYRIAKCTAAKCALRQLKKRGLLFPRKN